MERAEILGLFRAFFASRVPPEQLEGFETLRPSDLLQSSVEAMDLIFHLEESTGVELGLAEIGPAMATKNFSALADAVHDLIQKREG